MINLTRTAYGRFLINSYFPVNCKLDEWSDFTKCNGTCDGVGYHSRTRNVTTEAKNGGDPCLNLVETHECNTICDGIKLIILYGVFALGFNQSVTFRFKIHINYC